VLKIARIQAARRRSFPALLAVELCVFGALTVTPFLLRDRLDLVTLMTNVMILSIFAISFDMCWGFSGIMSFGQALFFGVAG
jgi:branched-chain amino acid transport system permease protein